MSPYVLDRPEQNRTVEVEAELVDPREAAAYLPGTSADAEVIPGTRMNAVRCPSPRSRKDARWSWSGDGSSSAPCRYLRNWEYGPGGVREGEVVTSLEEPEFARGARPRRP
jgi:hypothetical protein